VSWRLENGVTACQQNATIDIYIDDKLVETISINDACSSYGQFNVILPSCGPECDEILNPKIDLLKTEVDECDNYLAEDGVTRPYFDKFLKSFNILACYSTELNRWQFQIGNKIEFSSSVCLRENKYKYIFDLAQVKNIPKNECLQAETDFFNLLTLIRNPGQYFIIPVAELHEQIHVEQLDSLVNKFIHESNILSDIQNFVVKCNDINQKELAEALATQYFYEKLEKLFDRLSRKWGEMNNLVNEHRIQDDPRIKSLVLQYVAELKCN
jgi:hypothetical protein